MSCQVLIGFIGVIVGSFGGAFFAYLFAIRLQRGRERTGAAAEFRVAFTDEIRLLNAAAKDPHDIFTDAIIRHENAFIRFRFYLDKRKVKKFDETWKEYCDPYEYFSGGSVDKRKQCRKEMLERIDKLLSFAN